ncbi:uncharacterized protein LOC124685868 isoform X2 [Lolium rigidum]|uniref:uncharacterized protein LOC124685868 isoform X2 n=1 Tax=Lolium rigidum TaxID=89674 RepID=UPI001F5D24A5|nr:uncharacterized protein LOC124685868 isoform X2 [Lolium rigidum]
MSEPERRETSRKAAQLHAAQNHCLCSSQFCFSESNKPKPYDSTAFGTTRFQSFREATTQHKPNKDCFKQSLSTTREIGVPKATEKIPGWRLEYRPTRDIAVGCRFQDAPAAAPLHQLGR